MSWLNGMKLIRWKWLGDMYDGQVFAWSRWQWFKSNFRKYWY